MNFLFREVYKKMTPITVNGTAIPSPDMPFKWSLNDISSEDSGRDLNGSMDKDEVAKKVTLDCTWSHRTAAEISLLLNTVKPHTFVEVNYPDPMEGSYVTKTFYTGDVSCEMDASDNDEMYWSAKLTFIER